MVPLRLRKKTDLLLAGVAVLVVEEEGVEEAEVERAPSPNKERRSLRKERRSPSKEGERGGWRASEEQQQLKRVLPETRGRVVMVTMLRV